MSSPSTAQGVVAAGDARTAAVGASLLAQGGNAVDAAVGSTLAAFVVEPILTAPFGGGFATVGGGGKDTMVYDFFANVPGLGIPPAKETEGLDFLPLEVDFGATTQVFHVGRGACAVPLILRGLLQLHERRGALPITDVVEPSAKLCVEGLPISERIAPFLKVLEPILRHTKETTWLFAPKGHILEAGDDFKNPDLAVLLREVARGELDKYEKKLLDACGPPHGLLTELDLQEAKVQREPALEVPLGDCSVALNPPPSSGGLLVGFGLRLLQDVKSSVWKDDEAAYRHVLAAIATTNDARSMGLDRALQNPDMEHLRGVSREFLSDSNVDRWRESFERAVVEGPGGEGEAEKHFGSTTHISAIDKDGMACSITSSNGEGNGNIVPGCGIMANNFMGEEDLHPHGFHTQPAGPRLTSMMCPTLVFRNGEPILAVGTGGSNRIRTALLQVLVNHLLRGMSIEDAVRAPRMHYEGACLYIEATGPDMPMDTGVLDFLTSHVHDTVVFESHNMFFGGVHAAARGGEGAGDPRRGGAVCQG